MKKMNIEKIKPFFKLVLIYIVYVLFTSGVVKVYSLSDAMNPLSSVPIVIGTVAFLAESVYWGFSVDGKKKWSVGEYIGYGFLFLIIGAIVLYVSAHLWYGLSVLAETLIFHIPFPLKGYTADRVFIIIFIFAQFNLLALYRFVNKRKNMTHKYNSKNSNEDDGI